MDVSVFGVVSDNELSTDATVEEGNGRVVITVVEVEGVGCC